MFDKKLKKVEQVQVEKPIIDNKIRKSSFTTKIIYDHGDLEFKVKKITRFYVFSEQLRKWIKEKPDSIEMLPLSSLGDKAPQKQVSVPVIIQKSIVNQDGELTEGFFLYEATYKVSSEYPAVYLGVARNIVVQTHLINGQSFPLPVFGSIQGVSVTLNDKPKQISKGQALDMEEKGVCIFDKSKSGELQHFISHQ